MMPGINPRQMKQAMKRMGIQQEDIPAEQVIIRLKDREIVIENPSVQKVNMMGQSSYQVSGEEQLRSIPAEPEITDEDIKTVMAQANCSEEQARKALKEFDGDLAEAIMKLSE
jgi:nascent polypeptide-associated complex subunit alpha